MFIVRLLCSNGAAAAMCAIKTPFHVLEGWDVACTGSSNNLWPATQARTAGGYSAAARPYQCNQQTDRSVSLS